MTFVTSNVAMLIITLFFGATAYGLAIGRIRSRVVSEGVKSHSLVKYYGVYAALWTLVPALLLALIWAFAADPYCSMRLKRASLEPTQTCPPVFWI